MTAATAKSKKPDAKTPAKASSLNLATLGNAASLLGKNKVAAQSTGPMMVAMDRIREDPHQPRQEDNPGFSPQSIAEIGASILARGIKTPLSLRDDHEKGEGYFIINHGARRYRGARWAELSQVPAFKDNDYTDADQVIENIQRQALEPREIADFIGRKLAEGMKKGEIATALGMSAAFVSQHVTLLDLPDPIALAFNTGRVRDVTTVNELVKAYKDKPEQVDAWLSDEDQEITRSTVKLLREFLDEKKQSDRDPNTHDFINGGTDAEGATSGSDASKGDGQGEGNGGLTEGESKLPKEEKQPDPNKIKKAIVQIEHYGRPARLVLDRRPTEVGLAWMKYDDDGEVFEAAITEAKLVAIVEGA